MRKFNLILSALIAFTTSSICFGQEYIKENKTVTGVFEIENTTKSELFLLMNKWISINYNSSKDVIQLNDKEAGTIIVKGINEVVYENTTKALYPKNKYIKDFTTTKFNHLIEINVKDNKYRVIYRITDIASEDAGFNQVFFKGISFNGDNEIAISEYNEFMDSFFKNSFIGKRKRAQFKTTTKPMFDSLNNSIVANIKSTMKSIEKLIKSNKKDEDW